MSAHFAATSVVKRLTEAGHIAYFAGGWVRDYLMQHPSDDIDIATSASTQQIQALFPKTIPVGINFGIVIVVEGGHHFEVATFRKETGYLDGRRPTTIEHASPEEDAQRRDFTINGMFWDPLKEVLYDYVGGRDDLKKRVIRAIGDPHERFLEDRLRMMRAVRYSTRFEFPIEVETVQAILTHAPSLFPAVAIERVWQEFHKMSRFARFDTGLVMLHELGLLPTIFPELKEIDRVEVTKRVKVLNAFPKDTPTSAQLIELFSDKSLEELLELCDYLKLARVERELVEFLHRGKQMLRMPDEWQAGLEKIEWAHFYAHPHAELCIEIVAAHLPTEKRGSFLKAHEERARNLERATMRIRTQNPALSANDLLKEGIKPSKAMGALLKEAERLSVNRGIEDPALLIQLLKNSPLWNS